MPEKAPFRLFKRKKSRYFYARYLLPDGTYTAGRSTGETTKRKAESAAWEYVTRGKISAAAYSTIADMCDRRPDPESGELKSHFFDWDGEHTVSKRSAGKRISKQQCQRNNNLLDHHVIRSLGKVRLQDLDTATVRRFRNQLFTEGYAGATINQALGVLKQIIDAADEAQLIRHNIRIERAAVKNKARGILTQEEVQNLFREAWDITDPRPFAASMLAASAGFRLGEIQGLHISDIEPGRVTVRGVWSDSNGGYRLGTKNGQESRSVPIPESVYDALKKCIDLNPWGYRIDEYVFFSTYKPGRPCNDSVLTKPFYEALVRIGITERIRIQRNITFHSHRHFFNTLLLESRVPIEKIQRLTGHMSKSMTSHYYHIDGMEDVAEAQRRMFTIIGTAESA
ncbi:hypothetical protein B4O97_16335 [Marispirochaeta aestuarii]|uniref:Tyr recombinase domain-containing protein n=1 Tax=Marispirochaeta aestuarii TaxID=1963862 RepID=A0A1Y1RVQ3_9SPIO|nr:tyrosine-type recombinase/integrase [Marispirochaeta aestuarii]ORC32631.1 hypothetical protein B4O97_16335 [Marispirochaeta aestuarii]